MTQAGNEHSNDRNLDVGTCLVEDEEIVTRTGCDLDAGNDLVSRIGVELEARRWRDDRAIARYQERVVFQMQRRDTVEGRFLAARTGHHANGHELRQLGEGAQ